MSLLYAADDSSDAIVAESPAYAVESTEPVSDDVTTTDQSDNALPQPDQETILKINSNLEQVAQYLKSNDYRRAILLIKESEMLAPANEQLTDLLVRTLNNYAVALSNEKNFLKAIDTIEQAYIIDQSDSIKSNYLQILMNSVYYYIQQHDWKDALHGASYLRDLTDDSVESLRLCASIYSAQGRVLLSEGQAKKAKKAFFQALDYDSYNKDALYYLGKIAYQDQQLVKAKEYWDTLALYDNDSGLHELRIKLERELAVEQDLSRKEISHFDIHYDASINDKLLREIKSILEDAYSDIGARFSCYPKNKIPVLFLEHNTFKASTHLPHFVRGIYDGKIRIPILGRESDDFLQEIIYHEYVHVVVEQIGNGKVPRWFNEGIAVRFSEDSIEFEVLKSHVMDNTCIPFDELDFALVNSSDLHTVILAYEQSSTIVEFILYKYDMDHLLAMIDKFAEGESFHDIVKSTLHIDYDKFEKKWNRYVRQRVLTSTERKKLRYILNSNDN